LKYVVALREPPLAWLWVSQVLSGVGDQLYMLAAMWIAVDRFGNQAGYVAAAIGIGKITFGLLGGIVADRFDRRKVMILSDIVRFLAVVPLPVIAYSGTIQLWHLVVTGALIGAFGAFFDPALQASLPSITKTQSSLEAMTGLMDLTQRLARAVGPGLTGMLVTLMPLTQFFTIEAFSFLISAITIATLGTRLKWATERKSIAPYNSAQDIFKDVVDGFSYASKDKALRYCLVSLAFQAGLWGIAFTVGLPILVKQSFGDNVANYGYVVASYGVGSVLGNVVCANLHVRSSWLNVFMGDAICGLGFVVIALGNSMQAAVFGAVLAAVGGAAGDLLLLNLIMKEVPSNLLGKTMSLRMMMLAGGYALGLLGSAALFKIGTAGNIIAWCGGLMVLSCSYGAIRYCNYAKPEENNDAVDEARLAKRLHQ
jgi:DHA3 family macrolide efflux protein-like MFS transporter